MQMQNEKMDVDDNNNNRDNNNNGAAVVAISSDSHCAKLATVGSLQKITGNWLWSPSCLKRLHLRIVS
jgi:hypothetical protein